MVLICVASNAGSSAATASQIGDEPRCLFVAVGFSKGGEAGDVGEDECRGCWLGLVVRHAGGH